MKRDHTTRERALTELSSLLTGIQAIDEDVIWAWTQIYPKLSIDASRSVRVQAHKVQGQLGVALGKRFAKNLKYGVGPWVFGLFDTDRMVALSAERSLALVFPTQEKRDSLYLVFRDTLLDFIHETITYESVASLSDERYISKEEAELKYYRTLRCAYATLSYLITKTATPKADSITDQKFLLVLQEDNLWKAAYSGDVSLSRTVLKLVSTLFSGTFKTWTEAVKARVATALISKGLSSSSSFVSLEFLQALNNLTRYDPECWSSVTSKKTPLHYLTVYISKGNRGRVDHFWASILALLSLLPASLSPYSYEIDFTAAQKNADSITRAFSEAVTREYGPQSSHTWGYYMAVVERVTITSKGKNISCIASLFQSIQKTFFSKESQFSDDDSAFQVIGNKTIDISKVASDDVQKEIERILESLDLEQPSGAAINFLKLNKFALKALYEPGAAYMAFLPSDDPLAVCLKTSASKLVVSVVGSLKKDPSNSSKALFALNAPVILGKDLNDNAEIFESYATLVNNFFTSYDTLGQSELLFKVIKSYLDISLDVCAGFVDTLEKAQKSLGALDQSTSETLLLVSNLLSFSKSFSGVFKPSQSFSEFIGSYATAKYTDISSAIRKLFQAAILSHDVFIAPKTSGALFDLLIESVLKEDKNQEASLDLVLSIYKKDEKFVFSHFQTVEGKAIISQLWKASESHKHASEIDILLAKLEAFAVSSKLGGSNGVAALATDITEELRSGVLEEVALLVQRAERLVDGSTDAEEKQKIFEQLLLSKSTWDTQLEYSYAQGLSPSLSISPLFGNSVYLTSFEGSIQQSSLLTSAALVNMAIFTTSLIHSFPDLFKAITSDASQSTLSSLAYTSELIDVASAQSAKLYSSEGSSRDLLDVFSVLTSDIRGILSDAFAPLVGRPELYLGALTSSPSEYNPVSSLLNELWASCVKSDAYSFYSSRVLETIFSLVITSQDHSSLGLFKKILNTFDRNSLGCYALLNSLKHSKIIDELTYLRDMLLGSLASTPKAQRATKGLKYFVLLISSLKLQDSSKSVLPFFKLMTITRTLDNILKSDDVYDEAYTPLLSLIAQFYGVLSDQFTEDLTLSFWEGFTNIFEPGIVVTNMGSPFSYALLVSLLNLFDKMLTLNLTQMDGEDLSTALCNTSGTIFDLLLENLNEIEPATNQLEEVKSKAILRVLSKLPKTVEVGVENLYRLLSFEDKSLQILGLSLFKDHVASTQKEKALSFALLKQPINPQETDVESYLLPFELLSLVLDSPAGHSDAQKRQFLYVWFAIFLFFDTSVPALRQFYVSQLREGDYINTLLNYIASEIETGLEKDTETHWSIELLDPVVDLNNSYDIERCIWNIYYQTLNNAGPLVKTWFLDLKKKVRMDVEIFTKANISPLVIRNKATLIRKVLEQDNDLVDDTLDVQVSKSGKVVTAYYHIDSQTMEVAFSYPDTYPLREIQLEGIKLVGAREKQWRAWILASQSALRTNGGSLLDSLDLFKRNVTMHFNGVAACAICYSILHEDHSLPTKECGTCHNRFHTDCLYRWFKSGSTEKCPLCRSESFRIGH